MKSILCNPGMKSILCNPGMKSILCNPGMKSILCNPGIDYYDHLVYALRYALETGYIQQPIQKSYACECKHCEITLYTSTKRLNCEFCGSSDPEVFTCTGL